VKLYPGVTLMRDVSYGPEAKDVLDVFVPEKGPSNRTVLIYIPGGAGNKIEQQAAEGNLFYDNIGKWAVDNGMVGITIQRGGTAAGQNIALAVDWAKANIAKYKGNPDSIFLWAHSAGNGPLGQYIGRPDLYGLGVKGAIFMSGNPPNPNPPAGAGGAGRGAGAGRGSGPGAANGARGGGGGGFLGGNANGQIGTSMCINTGGAGSSAGVIRGPSSSLANQGADAAQHRKDWAGTSPWRWDGKQWVSSGQQTPAPGAENAGRGGGGGRGGPGIGPTPGGAPTPAAFTTSDGIKTTRATLAFAWAELDPGAAEGPPAVVKTIHDDLCKLEGPKAKDGLGHCPTLMWFKGESHMSEVFSLGSIDKTVSSPVLEFIKKVQ
jgi:Carboxylesterase family